MKPISYTFINKKTKSMLSYYCDSYESAFTQLLGSINCSEGDVEIDQWIYMGSDVI